MAFRERVWILAKILLPLLILVLINAYPANRAVEDALRQARIAQYHHQHQAAADALRKVYAREPWRTDLLEQIGRSAWQAGQPAEAVSALESAARVGVLSMDGSFLLAELHLAQGDQQQALAQWWSLLGDPQVEPPLKVRIFDRMVQLHSEQREYSSAVELLEAWRQLEPENGRVSFLLGLHLSVLDPSLALPPLLEASRLDPTYLSTVQTLRKGFNLASTVDDEGYGWLMIGRALGSAGHWDLALAAFEQAVAASPEYAEAWAFLGEARYQLGENAKAALDYAAVLNPQSTTVRALQALAYRRQGDPAQALALLVAVAQEEPQEPFWQVEIANVYVQTGDLDSAQEHYQRAVEIAPQVSLYWQILARFSVENVYHIPTVGLPAARQAVLLAPEDPGALDIMGWALVTQADFATGERFLQRALERNASYSPALLHLAQLYIQKQDFERAYFYLKRAQEYADSDQIVLIANRLLQRYYNEGG
jgi:tetratricopeptide (TPR) repeat protein